jgi:hypothetical protein
MEQCGSQQILLCLRGSLTSSWSLHLAMFHDVVVARPPGNELVASLPISETEIGQCRCFTSFKKNQLNHVFNFLNFFIFLDNLDNFDILILKIKLKILL